MLKVVASASLFIAITTSGAGLWALAPSDDQHYIFIDGESTRSLFPRTINLSKVRDRLMEAAAGGYGVQFVAGFSSSVNLLLKRGGAGAGNHRLVTTSKEGALLNELNQAASDGFVPVTEGIKALEENSGFGRSTTWVAVLVRQSDAPRVKYSLVKGTKEGEEALAKSAGTGRTLVGIVGRQGMVAANTLLFFAERAEDKSVAPSVAEREYRIIATARTSAIEKDLTEAAESGFRVIVAGFGYMTVVMARERGSAVAPVEYRILAMMRVATAGKELQAAGAEGFRVIAASENGDEAVFILHRRPGTSERFEYRLTELREATANKLLIDAEADGYRVVRLLNEHALLERSSMSSALAEFTIMPTTLF